MLLRVVVASFVLGSSAWAQVASSDDARLVTSDIPNFWRAIDRAPGGDALAIATALREEYFSQPSAGLVSFMKLRIADMPTVLRAVAATGIDVNRIRPALDAAPGTPDRAVFDSVVWPALVQSASEQLAATYLKSRSYYDGIRRNALAIDSDRAVKDSIRASFRRMKQLYPEARFSDVYFIIGRLTSGGTTDEQNRLLIGAEMFSRDATTPTDMLSDWLKAVTGQAKDLPQIVAHELAHTLQAERTGRQNLLATALNEGGADFIAELISGKHIINPAYAYGDAHEAALWREFRAVMDSSYAGNWLYNGSQSKDRPADLGYWMGYRITKAYYERVADKRAAVREILRFTDPTAFLAASGYSPR